MYSFFPRVHRIVDGATAQHGKVKASNSHIRDADALGEQDH
jgi:hypothetical protein